MLKNKDDDFDDKAELDGNRSNDGDDDSITKCRVNSSLCIQWCDIHRWCRVYGQL